MQTRKWQSKEGQDRYTTEIVAGNMQMLGGRQSNISVDPWPQNKTVLEDIDPFSNDRGLKFLQAKYRMNIIPYNFKRLSA